MKINESNAAPTELEKALWDGRTQYSTVVRSVMAKELSNWEKCQNLAGQKIDAPPHIIEAFKQAAPLILDAVFNRTLTKTDQIFGIDRQDAIEVDFEGKKSKLASIKINMEAAREASKCFMSAGNMERN